MYMQASKEGILKSHPLGGAQISAIKSINKASNSSIRAADGLRTVNLFPTTTEPNKTTEMTAVNPQANQAQVTAERTTAAISNLPTDPVCQEAAKSLTLACKSALSDLNPAGQLQGINRVGIRSISKIQAPKQAVTSIESNMQRRIVTV
jgi:hypothetical protein